MAAADRADRAVADGAELGPLHGVPITVKENIDVAGSATTNGVPAFEQAVAPLDAPVVERMRAAGAIPFARTNLPDFGLRVHTDSALRGLTRNPWRQDVTAGGSSGGEGSALASGMSPLGLGNDIGGSLRNPAHCCGIASIKPSTGVVPHASSLPPVEQTIMFQLMAVEGVMARRVADVRAGLLAVAGAHVRDPLALPVELDEPAPGAVLRIAVLAEPPGCDTDPGIAAAIRSTADALVAAGHTVEEIAPASFERTGDIWGGLLITDLLALRPLLDSVMGEGGRTFLDLAMTGTPVYDTAGLVPPPPRAQRGRPGVARVPHRVGRPAHADVDAATVPARRRPRLGRRGARRAPAAAPGAAGQPARPPGGRRAVRGRRRPARGRPVHGSPLRRPDGADGRPGRRGRRRDVHADRPRARVTPRLVAIDLPGGPPFVDALRDVWEPATPRSRSTSGSPARPRRPCWRRWAPAPSSTGGTTATLDGGQPVEPGDALVVATSGSTGAPKGVVLTHAAVAASALATSDRLGVVQDDHWLACLPLAHVGGLAVVTRAMVVGTSLTVLPAFEPTAVVAVGATHVSLVATALRRIDPATFRTIVLGGAAPPAQLPRTS